jgi:hypothetical protein
MVASWIKPLRLIALFAIVPNSLQSTVNSRPGLTRLQPTMRVSILCDQVALSAELPAATIWLKSWRSTFSS